MSTNQFIEQELPLPLVASFPLLFRRGHDLAQQILNENPCLRVPSLQSGDIRGAAIDFIVNAHISSGEYSSVTCAFEPYHKPTGHYLRIQTPNAVLTINHLAAATCFPREATFRTNSVRNNQTELFDEMERERLKEQQRQLELEKKQHLSLIYGNQDLEFMLIGAMHPAGKSWLGSLVDLFNRPRLIAEDDTEGKDAQIPMDVKNQFAEHLSKHAAK